MHGVDADFPARLIELDRVIEQVDQSLFEAYGVTGHDRIPDDAADQLDAAYAGLGFHCEKRSVHGVFHGDGARFAIAPAGFEVG